MNELGASRISRMLQRFFQVKGSNTPVPQLAPEIMPTFETGNPPFDALFLEGVIPYWRAVSIAAGGAGNGATVRLRNPTASGMVAVVKLIATSCSGNGNIEFQPISDASADLTNVLQGVGRDGRSNFGAAQASACRFSYETAAISAFGTGGFMYNNGTLQAHRIEVELALFPGQIFQVREQVGNLVLVCSMLWTERPVDDGELLGR